MSDGFFVADLPFDLSLGDQLDLSGKEAHHAVTVRRLRMGEAVTLTDGLGRGAVGPATAISPERLTIRVEQLLTAEPTRPAVTVIQALPKAERADQAIDWMTEVGVDAIVPWQAARSIAKWVGPKADKGRDRWAMLAKEASKQSRRLLFPRVEPCASTATVAELIRATPLVLMMDEQASLPLTDVDLTQQEQCLIIIGPEGGLTDGERAVFLGYGAVGVSLGPTVLRTVTAGAVAVTQVRAIRATQLRKR
ncbi:MAG: 16S rRNA (uracil(1498)-N(3))-methyltransferase [Propionibacteriaceae bacterium]|nr:16S rRNA (uracil(1498)-N(3))-methyltransferase [Propionibacteriaceae bacterium]